MSRGEANRMGAETIEVKARHVSLISREPGLAEAIGQGGVSLHEYQTATPGCDCKRRCRYRILCQSINAEERGEA